MDTNEIIAIAFFAGFLFAGLVVLIIAAFIEMSKNATRIDAIEAEIMCLSRIKSGIAKHENRIYSLERK
jgi:hypothetical protein